MISRREPRRNWLRPDLAASMIYNAAKIQRLQSEDSIMEGLFDWLCEKHPKAFERYISEVAEGTLLFTSRLGPSVCTDLMKFVDEEYPCSFSAEAERWLRGPAKHYRSERPQPEMPQSKHYGNGGGPA